MEAPDFNYRNATAPSSDAAGATGDSPATRPIESASASTACQTNNSKFAYILTAGVLGLITILALAITMLVFAIVSMGVSSSYQYYDEDALYLEDIPGAHGFGWHGEPGLWNEETAYL